MSARLSSHKPAILDNIFKKKKKKKYIYAISRGQETSVLGLEEKMATGSPGTSTVRYPSIPQSLRKEMVTS